MLAGARPLILPQGSLSAWESAGLLARVLSVVVRGVASVESSTIMVVKLGGFSTFKVPRMPCTDPALPILTVVVAVPTRLVGLPVARTLTMFPAALPVLIVILLVSLYSK